MTTRSNAVITVDATSAEAKLAILQGALSFTRMGEMLQAEVVQYFQQQATQRFASEGDSASGGGWEPLHPSTVDIRESEGFGGEHPINVRTGEMRSAVVGAAGDIEIAGDAAQLTWPGSAVDSMQKYITAQQGTSFNPNPAFGATNPRPVVAIDEADAVAVMQILENSLKIALTA